MSNNNKDSRLDRQSATGYSRKPDPKKEGAGKGNWGSEAEQINEAVKEHDQPTENQTKSRRRRRGQKDPETFGDLNDANKVKTQQSWDDYLKAKGGKKANQATIYDGRTVASDVKKKFKTNSSQKETDALFAGQSKQKKNRKKKKKTKELLVTSFTFAAPNRGKGRGRGGDRGGYRGRGRGGGRGRGRGMNRGGYRGGYGGSYGGYGAYRGRNSGGGFGSRGRGMNIDYNNNQNQYQNQNEYQPNQPNQNLENNQPNVIQNQNQNNPNQNVNNNNMNPNVNNNQNPNQSNGNVQNNDNQQTTNNQNQ